MKPMRPRCVHRHHSRRGPFVWAQNRRHRPMLGQQQLRSNRCALRYVHRHHSRRGRNSFGHSCGLRTDGTAQCWGWNTSVKPMRPQVRSPPSQPVRSIRVGSEPTAPPNAGATTATVKPMRPQARSPPSQPARSIRVGSEPTAPPNAGAGDSGQTDAPTGTFTAITAGWGHSCGLRTDGTAQCWGHSCGLRTDGTAQCWGNNNADAPSGTFTDHSQPSCGLPRAGTGPPIFPR